MMEPEVTQKGIPVVAPDKTGHNGTPAAPRRFRWLKLILFLAAIVSVGIAALWLASRKAGHTKGSQKVADAAVLNVQVVFPQKAPPLKLTLPGHTHPYYQSPIYAQTTGYLKNWYYDIGAKVKAGDILGVIDTPEVDQELSQAQATLTTAKARLGLATANVNEARKLWQTNVDSKRDFETMQAQFLAQQSTVNGYADAVQRLQALENFKILRAPFDGIVINRSTDIGDLVVSGSSHMLFKVAQEDPLRVYVGVPENFAREIHEGIKADLTFDELPGRHFTATVVTTAHAINPDNRTQLTELQVPNPSNELWPGAYTEAHFNLHSDGNTLVIPGNTELFQREGPQVGVVTTDGKVELRKIDIGEDLGAQLVILKGLSTTDRVIVNPSDSLSTGMKVHVVAPNQNSAKAGK
jgi:multidrug efflux system membrane fusion protein